jgi:hypothetical protein
VSGPARSIAELAAHAPVRSIGIVGGEELTIALADAAAQSTLAVSLADLSRAHSEGLAEYFA